MALSRTYRLLTIIEAVETDESGNVVGVVVGEAARRRQWLAREGRTSPLVDNDAIPVGQWLVAQINDMETTGPATPTDL